jgi:hypothetical protein
MNEGIEGILARLMAAYENPAVNTAIGFTPVAGDIQSGAEAIRSAMKGNYGEAALNAVGLLPFVPALGGMARNASPISKALDSQYDEGKRHLVQQMSTTGEAPADLFSRAIRNGQITQDDATKLQMILNMLQKERR